MRKFTRVGWRGLPPDSPSSRPNTHTSMLFLLYELRNELEWVNNTGTLIPKTSEVYFLLCWASGRHFVNFFCRQLLKKKFNFWEHTQLIEIYPKMNFSSFYWHFFQEPKFLMTLFPKVQISKFRSYELMNWVQASMLKGFLWGLGTCHTFHNWVSTLQCPTYSCRNPVIPVEFQWNPQEFRWNSTGIRLKSSRLRLKYCRYCPNL